MPNGEKIAKRFMVYRCVMRNDSHHWFISSIPPGKEYGTNQDVDYFSIPSSYEPRYPSFTDDVFPPKKGWKATSANASGSEDPRESGEVQVTWEIVEEDHVRNE